MTGTLNMAHLAVRLDALENPALTTALAAPLLVAFGIKAAVFPFFFWLPASYHTPPTAVSALFAGPLTKVGVYSVIRVVTLMFDREWALLGEAILWVAGLTMVTGVLGAVSQNEVRRILSFHIVSQIGYMLMGLGIAVSVVGSSPAGEGAAEAATIALTGSVFYILHHIVVKTNLFLIGGAIVKVRGTGELRDLGGMMVTNPGLALLFLVSALSLAGVPVLSGFWAKLLLVLGGLGAGAYWIVGVSLVVSIFTLFSMTKIWSEAFWRAAPERFDGGERPGALVVAPIVGLAAVTLGVGFGAAPVYRLAEEAAAQLLSSEAYIEAALPPVVPQEGPPP